MSAAEPVKILLVDDQPAKLLSYEVILSELGEILLKAGSAQEAFQHLLQNDVAVVLVDVYMPDLDGFELARMIREHPRFQRTAIIFISGVLLTDLDFLRGYEVGAVDYVSVPVIPEVLRAKVRVFAELYRKTQQLERLNRDLERRVAERTAALEASTRELRRSEERLRLAFEAAQMGWWDYDFASGALRWSPSLVRIMGFAPEDFGGGFAGFLGHVHPEDRERFRALVEPPPGGESGTCELRFIRPDGSVRWSLAAGHLTREDDGTPLHFAGVDLDITERKEVEERQQVLVGELDHRAKNLLAVVQSVLHLTRAATTAEFVAAVEGRIKALSRTHALLSESRWRGVELGRLVGEELAPFRRPGRQIEAFGPVISLRPGSAQSLALALHELATNAAKYGALSVPEGGLTLTWTVEDGRLVLRWTESGGPPVTPPTRKGFGTKVIGASIEQQLGGAAELDWHGDGLRCRLSVPQRHIESGRPARDERGGGRPAEPATGPIAVRGGRVLVVEDEALVATMLREQLAALGYSVLGPAASVAAALTLILEQQPDVAVLDLNLGGELAYPAADLLAARGVPFAFITGYDGATIERRYAGVPVLAKPLDPQLLRRLFDGSPGTAPARACG
ncbi:MAG: response regulator [Dongiaceae bacterium]